MKLSLTAAGCALIAISFSAGLLFSCYGLGSSERLTAEIARLAADLAAYQRREAEIRRMESDPSVRVCYGNNLPHVAIGTLIVLGLASTSWYVLILPLVRRFAK